MWCKFCNIETNESACPICGKQTSEDIPIEVYWCDSCKVPVIKQMTDIRKTTCTRCGREMKYLAKDIRPVFPEERLLMERILGKEANFYAQDSVWASTGSKYYINGKAKNITKKMYKEANIEQLSKDVVEYKSINTYEYFDQYVERFVEANRDRLNYLIDEATEFVRETAAKFKEENRIISFSGGKDSTVTADVVTKALSDPSLVHIFGNTTLEFPTTLEYAKRFRENHPHAIFQVAQNKEQIFMDMVDVIGPPARMMRWCCSMFKTGSITRVLNSMYRNQQVLTFYGIRKSESVSRSKYNRVEDSAESVKINKQTVAAPIFFWFDVDIWLYILAEKIDFNDAYRYGYERVGCWLCPNNNDRDIFLTSIYMPERSKEWREFLISFAKKIGKPDPEEYIDSGAWKARQGGNGLPAAQDVKIKFTNCTTEEHAKIYKLSRPFSDELVGMFVPFGRLAPELGRKLLHETIVVDIRTNVPIISIQPFKEDGFEYAVKIRTMNVADHDALQRKAGYQVRKFNACHRCLKCESVCKAGAITVMADDYFINPDKCVHCGQCVNQKILRGGCMMDKYLRTKD